MSDALVVNEIFLSVQGESTFAGLPCVFVRLTACNLRCSYCDTAYAFSEGRKMSLGEIEAQVLGLAKPFTIQDVGADDAGPSARLNDQVGHEPSVIGNQPEPIHDAGAPVSDPARSSPVIETRRVGDRRSEVKAAMPDFESRGSPYVVCRRLPLVELTGGEPLLQPNSLPLMKSLCDQGLTVLLETSGALDIAPVDPRVCRIMDLKCPSSGECARNRGENLRHLKPTDELKFVIGTQEDYDWAKQQVHDHKLASICPVLFSWVTPLLLHQQDRSLKEVPAGQAPITRRQLVEQTLADALPVRFQLQIHKFIWPPDQRSV